MNFCTSCGSRLAGESPRFCGQCGTPVPQEEPSIPTGGAWSEPMSLSLPGHAFSTPRIAVDSRGNVTLVWDAFDGSTSHVMAARLVDGKWTAPYTLSSGPHRASDAHVAVDGAGVVTAVWLECPDIWDASVQASRCIDGTWTAKHTLSSPEVGAFNPRVIADSSGVATVVWDDRGRKNGRGITVQAARCVSGRWTGPVDLSDASVESRGQVLTAGSGGQVIVMWEQGDDRKSLYATKCDGTKWAKPIAVSRGNANSSFLAPALAASPRGDVVAVWRQGPDERSKTRAARYVDGSWVALENIPAPDGSYGHAVAVDAKGIITVLWRKFLEAQSNMQDENLAVVQASRYVNDAWTKPEDLCLCGERSVQEVAADSRGIVTAVWDAVEDGRDVVQSSRFVEGEWTPVVTLSSSDEEDATSPRLVIDSSDNVVAVWDRSCGWLPTERGGHRRLSLVQVSRLEAGA